MRRPDPEHTCDEAEASLIAAARRRSECVVQSLFTLFATSFALLALIARHAPDMLALDGLDTSAVSEGFLALAACYAAIMVIWDRIWNGPERPAA